MIAYFLAVLGEGGSRWSNCKQLPKLDLTFPVLSSEAQNTDLCYATRGDGERNAPPHPDEHRLPAGLCWARAHGLCWSEKDEQNAKAAIVRPATSPKLKIVVFI